MGQNEVSGSERPVEGIAVRLADRNGTESRKSLPLQNDLTLNHPRSITRTLHEILHVLRPAEGRAVGLQCASRDEYLECVRAILEYFCPDNGRLQRSKGYLIQTTTTTKCCITYILNIIRYHNAFQASTTIKCIIIY